MSEYMRETGDKAEARWSEPVEASEERALIEVAQSGDDSAFEKLVVLFQDRIYALAWQLMQDHDEAQDLAQEVFISCYRNLKRFRAESRLGTWLYRITVNRAKNRWKYNARRMDRKHDSIDASRAEDDERPAIVLVDKSPDAREVAQGKERMEILEEHIAKLPQEFQEVVALRFGQDMSYEEIAETLECSLGTVKSRISRARSQLRESMGDLL